MTESKFSPSGNTGETDDLLITPYLTTDQLPAALQRILPAAATPEEADMLLISALSAASACLPNRYFQYGLTRKRYYANLQTFIMAGAASGKGIAQQALALVAPIDKEHPLLLPGDSTYPAFFLQLYLQDGIGYMHESEGSVITDIWRSGAMSYNTALRKAAEHEQLSRNRVMQGTLIIPEPRLSMLLTGTFDQFRALVPSVQNGFFSRLTMLVVRKQQAFRKEVFRTAAGSGDSAAAAAALQQSATELKRLYDKLRQSEQSEFRITEAQAEEAGSYFADTYGALIRQLGPNFHPTVVRMGVTMLRIAMILSLLRDADATGCSDADFLTAQLLAGKLLLHAADAFMQIEGADQEAIPAQKTAVQKQSFLATLPEEFEAGECMAKAKQQGIAERTARRWMSDWVEKGLTQKTGYGIYRKAA